MKTNKMKLLKIVALILTVITFSSCGSSQKVTKSYSRADELNEKIAEYTHAGWQIHGSTRTLKGKLTEHYEKMDGNPDLYEIIGTSTGCRSITACRATALNAASIDFATKMGQDLKGKTMRDMGLDEGAEPTAEYNKFQEACIGSFQGSIKGDMTESFALIQPNANGVNNYIIYYFVDKQAVRKKRTQAIKDALEESKLRQEYAKSIEKFVDGDMDK